VKNCGKKNERILKREQNTKKSLFFLSLSHQLEMKSLTKLESFCFVLFSFLYTKKRRIKMTRNENKTSLDEMKDPFSSSNP
jgi:hypothetical protein